MFACCGKNLKVVSLQKLSTSYGPELVSTELLNFGVSTHYNLKTKRSKSDPTGFNSYRDPKKLWISVHLRVKPATVHISVTENGLSWEPERGGQQKHTSKKSRLAEVEKVVKCLVGSRGEVRAQRRLLIFG